MNRLIQVVPVLLVGLGSLGVEHPIFLVPDIRSVQLEESPPVQYKVGYYIPSGALEKEVVTPGGGGEKVRYRPYRDLESGFYGVLATVFIGVEKVHDPKDVLAMKRAGISWLVTPEIVTTSSSDSALVWPPSEFNIQLKLTITDLDGRVVDMLQIHGRGRAEMREFSDNLSLSAVRAANDLMLKMYDALRYSKVVSL